MPSLPRNCYKTPHGFVFRMVVPEPLRPALGKREIKKALGKDYRQAVSQARLLAIQADRQFTELRDQQARETDAEARLASFVALPESRRLKPITEITPELIAGLRGLWLSGLDADLAWRREGVDDADFDALQDNVTSTRAAIAKALARGQAEPFIPVVRTLLHGRGYELAVSAAEERRLTLDVLVAIQQGYDILQQRQQGRLSQTLPAPGPVLPAAWEPPAPVAPAHGPTWADLLAHWKADRPRVARTEFEVEALLDSLGQDND